MSKKSSITKKKPSVSGAKGGPSTSRGMNYQVDFVVEEVLGYISRALCDPLKQWEVTLEPRVSSSSGLTNWDVGFSPENKLLELKLRPTREDLIAWVQRIGVDAVTHPSRSYCVVYSKGAGKHIDELDLEWCRRSDDRTSLFFGETQRGCSNSERI